MNIGITYDLKKDYLAQGYKELEIAELDNEDTRLLDLLSWGLSLQHFEHRGYDDEHENNIKWTENKNLGILAKNTPQVIVGINKIKENFEDFEDNLLEFSKNFIPNGAENTAKIASEILEEKR